ncbi:2-dehydro-3-deoxygalactonokinase [Exilibacterium tricleocarpae]|uniref:2-dehydro-3-deoxygalactonokinase n=1 Tax=Exilibacterium tricleocarpae TaxID=2591008 RepID=UPI0015D31722|nr:2-dehydro-3-deoxygalactonokinase [Exilibacterium tricleocarpae]
MAKQFFIGINWGSSNLRAYLLDEQGTLCDSTSSPKGVTKLDYDSMTDTFLEVVNNWPYTDSVYLSGMIGSPMGWTDIPYKACPVGLNELMNALSPVEIGGRCAVIVPGVRCSTAYGDPEIMRGEELEIIGMLAVAPQLAKSGKIAALPGTHSKWVQLSEGRIVEFFTSMGSEVFDRLAEKGLLNSVMTGEAHVSEPFTKGVRRGASGATGLGRLLFGVRAQAIDGRLSGDDAASYARGLLIGAEIADANSIYSITSYQGSIPLVGNAPLCKLYAAALELFDVSSHILDADKIAGAGYTALHRQALVCRQ